MICEEPSPAVAIEVPNNTNSPSDLSPPPKRKHDRMNQAPKPTQRSTLNVFTLLLLSSTLLLWACSPAQPPEQVATRFWLATLTGDQPVVQATTLPSSFADADFDAARHGEMFEGVVVGEAQVTDDRARIDTELRGIFYGEPDTIRFNTVAVIHEGEWKIDYPATASEMIGVYLGETVTEVDRAMRRDLKILEESLEASIRADLQNPPGLDSR